MQDTLIPNTVFLVPMLAAIGKLGGPVTVETAETSDEPIRVRSGSIEVAVPGTQVEAYALTIKLGGNLTTIMADSDKRLDTFAEAAIVQALRADLINRGHKLTLKIEVKDGIILSSFGIDVSPPPGSTLPESYIVAETWLQHAESAKRLRDRDTLNRVAQGEIDARREELRKERKARERALEAKNTLFANN